MNHTMISMHDFNGRRTSFDAFDNFHHGTEHMTEEEKRDHELQENFKKDISGYVVGGITPFVK